MGTDEFDLVKQAHTSGSKVYETKIQDIGQYWWQRRMVQDTRNDRPPERHGICPFEFDPSRSRRAGRPKKQKAVRPTQRLADPLRKVVSGLSSAVIDPYLDTGVREIRFKKASCWFVLPGMANKQSQAVGLRHPWHD
ncbi:MAG: hypothetical protein A3A44_03470 [Candidatus Sungbacteria bacterium RIFCSPLOWO2_01_FULL_60_25]|uniref:Uncharacterized protein n=1 Tax=Candidatus Sungbacteria bacterium RIFCSPLOWO2_01_FULL_60_25 TaxID=1802281 RepID=A0A1G2LCH4_9BACT|nr:MAG: hypothetical protein A3A44_03470 [Candidatus Sungbacteria bacterium RIFCSPLOWO2_01_FULL_60_25]